MQHQRFEGERTLMRIHIEESDRWHGKLLYQAIVELFRREGFSGVTVLRGVGGYGSSSRYHTDKVLRLSQDLPIVIEMVEDSEHIERILPKLDEMVDGGLITIHAATIWQGDVDRRQRDTGSWGISQRGAEIEKLRPLPRVLGACNLPVGAVHDCVGAISQ